MVDILSTTEIPRFNTHLHATKPRNTKYGNFPIVLVGIVGEWCEARCERVMSERLSGVDCGAVWGCGLWGCGSVNEGDNGTMNE